MGRFISIWFLFPAVGAEISTCTSSQDENSLLQDRNMFFWNRATGGDEVDFVVTKQYIDTDAPGIAFRVSMDLADRDPNDSLSLWGSIVRGVPVGTEWLKVGSLYLPTQVGGHAVLEREGVSGKATLAVTGQEPEAAEPEATEPEATETEATEPEAIEPEAVAETAETTVAEEQIEEELEDAASALEGEQVTIRPETTDETPSEPETAEEAMELEVPEVTEQEREAEATQEETQEVATEPETPEVGDVVADIVAEPEATQQEAAVVQEITSDLEVVEPEFVEAVDPEPEPEPFNGVTVEFGVIFRSLPMLDFQSGTFTASLAFTQRWPSDAASYDAAAVGDGETPWSPNLVVTNHDIGGVEAISTSRTVNQTSGMITQVDYLTVRVLQTFKLNNFPFDSQVLSVRVAPASPGDVSMKLVPIDVLGEPTLDPELLEGHGFRLEAVNEEQSILQAEDMDLADPARGVVEIAMGRRASAYFSQLFLPALLVLCVCWSTFFLPVPDTALATPRTAVTATVFVAMLVLFLHVEQMVPARFGRMWIDVFMENVAILVFAAVAFNTLEQHVHSNMKRPTLSSRFTRELQVFYPLLSAGLLGICFCVTHVKTLSTLSAFSRFYLLMGILGYSGAAYARALVSEEGKPRGAMVVRSPR